MHCTQQNTVTQHHQLEEMHRVRRGEAYGASVFSPGTRPPTLAPPSSWELFKLCVSLWVFVKVSPHRHERWNHWPLSCPSLIRGGWGLTLKVPTVWSHGWLYWQPSLRCFQKSLHNIRDIFKLSSLRMASPQDGLTEKSNVLIHSMSATQTTELGVWL